MILAKCKEVKNYKVQSLPEIHLLKVLGIREGISLTFQSKQPFGGPVVIKIGSRSIAIAKDIAEDIIIQEVV